MFPASDIASSFQRRSVASCMSAHPARQPWPLNNALASSLRTPARLGLFERSAVVFIVPAPIDQPSLSFYVGDFGGGRC